MIENSNKIAASATLHCLSGCAIGEILGMIISSALGWAATGSVVLSIALAFVFGYSFSMRPLIANKVNLVRALKIALAADTVSIAVMEIADNGFILAVPGAIHAGLDTLLFWISLAVSLAVAFVAAFPVNKYLISRGKGHAIAHKYHSNHKHK